MAFQTRGRDPFLDRQMAEAVEKRGKELLGLVLLVLGAAAGAMILSYHPEDPSWISATDAPVRNWLGRPGAEVAAPLFMILGWGSWGLALVPTAWGLRLVFHQGEERAVGRLIFAPFWLALLSIHAATLVPGAGWSGVHSFGLGGLFGDTVLGATLGLMPLAPGLALKLLAPGLALAVLGLGAFALGFTRTELGRILRFLLVGVVMSYAALRAALAWVLRGVAGAARAVLDACAVGWRDARRGKPGAAQNLAAREVAGGVEEAGAQAWQAGPVPKLHLARHPDDPAAARAEPPLTAPVGDGRDASGVAPGDTGAAAPGGRPARGGGLLSRVAGLRRRAELVPLPASELIEPDPPRGDAPAPDDDRVRARILDAVRARRGAGADIAPPEKPLTRGRGHGPQPLIFAPRADLADSEQDADPVDDLPSEPPLTATPDTEAPLAPAADARPSIPVPEPRRVVQHAPRRAPQPSDRARAEAQPELRFEDTSPGEYELPPLALLASPDRIERHHLSDEALKENARMLENVLDDYGVKGEIVSVRPGPVVTMYELEPAPGLKASRVIGLADDIARSMAALSARVSTVPGRSIIGIELPNEKREMVSFREILSSRAYGDGTHRLPLALGKSIDGDPIVTNLSRMPHLLIAGTTGSGKSVAINTMILSLLYKLAPDECRLIMIDPKMLELSVYDGIPHLLSPVVTDPKKAVVALKWVVAEMEERYRKMSKMGVRNIDGYNGRVAEALAKGEMFSRTVQTGFDDGTGEPVFETEEFAPERMPYIVVIVDEMADLMMVAGKEIEACIQRLAQMARASGIHLIMATQRPSVDVITGTIKANFPTRISFQVTSKIDSRTILGEMGAEQLLGMGDMLYMAGGGRITRCHGPFVSDEEVEEVVRHLKAWGPPDYVGGVQDGPDDEKAEGIDAVLGLNTGGNTDGDNALYDQAVQIAIRDRKCSTSYIQRKLAIGYNKAARLVEQMEEDGVVSGANHVGKREVLVPEPQ